MNERIGDTPVPDENAASLVDGVAESMPPSQEQVSEKLHTLLDTLQDAVLERYRMATGQDVHDIEDTTAEGMATTMHAWSHYFNTLFVGSVPQIELELKKAEDAGFDVSPAHARLQFILGNRNRDSRADRAAVN